MNVATQDDQFLDAVDAFVLDTLPRIGDGPSARYAFFKRFLGVA